MDKKILLLFDVDLTLTPARQSIQQDMLDTLRAVHAKGIHLGIVSGSDIAKVTEQVTQDLVNECEYCFSENGLLAMKNGKEFARQSFKDHLGEDNLKRLINFSLRYIADLDIPVKRGTFLEYRNGMMNISPIGRNCSKQERDEFEEFDRSANVRTAFVSALETELAELNLQYSIGGQISFDVFPKGWDKSFCLQFVEKEYDEIHFFGDKCKKGGNDHEIYEDPRTLGHEVTCPQDTIKTLRELFLQ